MRNKKLEPIIKAAKEHYIVNACETFVYERNGEYRYCDLKTLNYIVNELHETVTLLYNVYQICEPIVSKMN